MHQDKAFTREDAIKAVIRLHESERKVINADAAKSGTVSQKAKNLAGEMPSVSNDSHPNWYGSTMDIGSMYEKKDGYLRTGKIFPKLPAWASTIFAWR